MSQSNLNSQAPRSLYSQSEAQELKILSWNLSAYKNLWMRALSFGAPLPLGSYAGLVKSLRNTSNNDELWFLLALWLKNEAIREPEKFLPRDIYQRLTKKARQGLHGISFTDMRNFELVRCWEPYFERLLRDKRLRRNTPNLETVLRDLGYTPQSVELIMQRKWRSPRDLACEWLAGRNIISSKRNDPDPARTLRNAYSRVKTGASKAPIYPAAGSNARKAK